MAGDHALIFGASGISGWAITNQILNGYPSKDAFSKVTALTNRPLSRQDALWPESDKLQLVSGIDLLNKEGQKALEDEMKSKIEDIDTVTQVFFFAYIMDADPKKEIDINVALLERAVTAVEHLSSKLKFIVFPSGTKAYGVHLIDDFPFKSQLPMKESLPRIPEPHASEMFYYNQTDYLASSSKGKSWGWAEVIPDVIIGFVPNNNIYCLPQQLGLYLSLYRYVNGEGAEVQFPGTEQSWTIKSNDSSQDIIAKFSIYISLHPESCAGGNRFNVADNAEPSSWSKKWPVICEYFGLKGVAPPKGGSGPQPEEYISQHIDDWNNMAKEKSLVGGRVGNNRTYGGFPYFIMTMFNFDRHIDLSLSHKAWGSATEQVDTKTAWYTAFDRFRKAKIFP